MTEKIRSWWSEDGQWFCILADDGNAKATVSLTSEDTNKLVQSATRHPQQPQGGDALKVLGTAILKFAPDLAQELVKRWHKAKAENDEALDRFLAVLRGEPVADVAPTQQPQGGGVSDPERAIEFGEYLAVAVEQFMDFINKTGIAAGKPAPQDAMTDHWRGLQSAIYDFRKRKDKALASLPSPAAEENKS